MIYACTYFSFLKFICGFARCLRLHYKVRSQCLCTGTVNFPHNICSCWILEQFWLPNHLWRPMQVGNPSSVFHDDKEPAGFSQIRFPSKRLSQIWVINLFPVYPERPKEQVLLQKDSLIHTCSKVFMYTSLLGRDIGIVQGCGFEETSGKDVPTAKGCRLDKGWSGHTVRLQAAYLLPSASSVESGSSFLLVSGSRKASAPLIIGRLLKPIMGMVQWYMANMLSSGDSNPPNLHAMEPKPEAVCLKKESTEIFPHGFTLIFAFYEWGSWRFPLK